MSIRTYSELVRIPTFEERFEYLKLSSKIGIATFGYDRVFNQRFYTSTEWRLIRDRIIARDSGCDLGINDRQLFGRIYIHHMNPISLDDIKEGNEALLDPDQLICCSHDTHNAIHYGDINLLPRVPTARSKNDTCPWRMAK